MADEKFKVRHGLAMGEGSIRFDSASAAWQLSSDGSTYQTIATNDFVEAQSIATLDDIGDVTISSVTSGDFLKWNGSAWVNDPINLGTDTTGNYVADVVAGAAITVTHSPSASSVATIEFDGGLSALKDVDISNPYPTDGQFLQWSSACALWIPGSVPTINNLDDVGDVTITSATSGDFLKWNGSAWVNDPIDLGTDTVGNFVSDVVGGTGVTVSHTAGEGSTASIAIGQDVATTASVEFAAVTVSSAPTLSGHLTNKQYVDALAAGINWHNSVELATVAPLPNTPSYNNGTDGVGATLTGSTNVRLVVDGFNATTGTRVLVKDQSTAAQNGIYDVTEQGSAGGAWVLTRSSDYDGLNDNVVQGDATFTVSGSINANQGFILTSNGTGTNKKHLLGVDGLTFTQFTGTSTILAGSGISKTGNTLSVDSTVATLTGAQTLTNKTLTSPTITGVSPTITLSGDLSGSATFTNLGNATLTASIEPNSVLLGTDTTGNYVSGITAGTGVTVTHTPGEGSTASVAIGQDVSTSANVQFANITATGLISATASSGDEGGELRLAAPATNTTLAGAVSVDIYQNKLRFFENGGTSRGFYIDLTSGGSNAGTNLAAGGGGTLDALSDVSAPSPSTGEYLRWNGTAWVDSRLVSDSNQNFAAGTDTLISGSLTGNNNTGVGSYVMGITSTGFDNTAVGYVAGQSISTGNSNTFVGRSAGNSVNTGIRNTAVGHSALGNTSTASSNTAIGRSAGLNANGSNNVFVGDLAGDSTTTGSNVIVIGAGSDASSASVSNEITLGNGSITRFRMPGLALEATSGTLTTSSGTLTLDSASGTVIVDDNLTVSGNLTVNGTTTTVNTATLNVSDNIIVLNNDVTSTPTEDAGIEVERGTSANVLVRWNETSDKWELTNDGGTYGNIVTTADSGTITNSMMQQGTIKDAQISDSAAIALSKLASGTAGQILVYNSGGILTAVQETGDVTISDSGVAAIASGVIVNADISDTAAIALGKLADVSTNAQSASYTLVLADKNRIVEMGVASANNLTVPLNSSVAFPIGSQINILQTGSGQTTVVAAGGVTINGTPGLKLRTQWSYATLIKRGTDTWVLVGDLSA